ncbi:response regulator [Legionella impletisoli]|uniref:Response regulatory domain-containing protein n=1 Tax=Legionella impletisoli TaxID=343510 RepID=A0A917K1C4_9GAMM|nr:response regulator [Legionella impletisoli]GGI93332.1 hypothetical protein GCM10007966_22370 [Legionella impletisoli]
MGKSNSLPQSATPADLRVLIAEDSMVNQKQAKRLFTRKGVVDANIITADNGLMACEFVRNSLDPFHIIYMDGLMPEMGGREATLEIRRIEQERFGGPESVIFSCSDSEFAPFQGANTRLDKPLKPDELERLMINVIKNPNIYWENYEDPIVMVVEVAAARASTDVVRETPSPPTSNSTFRGHFTLYSPVKPPITDLTVDDHLEFSFSKSS